MQEYRLNRKPGRNLLVLVRSALTTRVALHCVDAAILDGGEPRRWLRLLATGQFRHMRLVGKSSEPVDSVRFAAPTANGSYWPGTDLGERHVNDRYPHKAAHRARNLRMPSQWLLAGGRSRSTSALEKNRDRPVMAGG